MHPFELLGVDQVETDYELREALEFVVDQVEPDSERHEVPARTRRAEYDVEYGVLEGIVISGVTVSEIGGACGEMSHDHCVCGENERHGWKEFESGAYR